MATRSPVKTRMIAGESFLLESLPINTLNSMHALVSRLRNPTLYIFPADRQTVVSLAETIATRSLLQAMHIPFTEVERYNADHMSPNGLLPLLIQDAQVVGGYEKILDIVNTMFPHLLANTDKAAYNVITTVIRPTLNYCQFLTNDTVVNGYDIVSVKLPFPINHIVPFQQHLRLRIDYYGVSERKIFQELDTAFHDLNVFTGKGIYPQTDKHLAFSFRLYGYLYAIIDGFLEEGKVRRLLQRYSELNSFYDKMSEINN
ncbi:Metaxin-2 isoform X1 [Oopsacas minuta]|uniref:Metaxin-2 isoform X1 n=1 Tax=Oopsacas minuta TaxID=111878 RepID=A0AAV7KDF4_9METZ|nr:Metaxin-2 isoform X1 [Oopsacas minuta]